MNNIKPLVFREIIQVCLFYNNNTIKWKRGWGEFEIIHYFGLSECCHFYNMKIVIYLKMLHVFLHCFPFSNWNVSSKHFWNIFPFFILFYYFIMSLSNQHQPHHPPEVMFFLWKQPHNIRMYKQWDFFY